MPVSLDIPDDLVSSVVHALYYTAETYRRDHGHQPDGIAIAILKAYADRLGAMAEALEKRAERQASEEKSMTNVAIERWHYYERKCEAACELLHQAAKPSNGKLRTRLREEGVSQLVYERMGEIKTPE